MHEVTDQPCGYDAGDAMAIARWCWPRIKWMHEKHGIVRGVECLESFNPDQYDDEDTLYAVNAAERVLIERGLAEEYGKALGHSLLVDGPFVLRTPCGGRSVEWNVCGEDLTTIATAPLNDRVRAMAAVIKGLTAS